jgi:hypothetical protein
MTRRWLVLVALAAVVALGAAWWLYGDWLSTEERRAVGTWRRDYNDGSWAATFGLTADHHWHGRYASPKAVSGGEHDGSWFIREGKFCIELENNPIRRAFRPIAHLVSVDAIPIQEYPMTWVTDREFVLMDRDGVKYHWTREPGD